MLLDNDGASFGLGFQIHEITAADDEDSVMRSLGHAGLGGSIVLCIPEMGLSVAFTTNQLSTNNVAKERLLRAVLDEYGLVAPKSLLE
jgi:CubicO group peptidase (beta-lactamase class C family)